MTDAQEKILHRSLHRIAKEQGYNDYEFKITPITSDGANYTSRLFLATISAANKADLKLFAKVAVVGETFRSQMMTDIFTVEQYAYTTLAKIYDRIQEKYKIPAEDRLVMPKFYGYDDTYLEETLILQDLSAEGYTTYDRLEPITLEYASRSLEELAKMHALSIVFQEEYPEEFEKASKILQYKSFEENEVMAGAMAQMVSKSVAAVSEELRGRLQTFLERVGPDFMLQFVGPDKRPVLAHGDFRMSNIMHRANGDKLDVTIIDYQCVHVGVGVRDALYLLLPGSDERFRGRHFYPLLDHYYERLCETLRRLHRDPGVLFPRADYDFEVKKNLPCGLLLGMCVLPVLTVAAEHAPRVDAALAIENIFQVPTSDLFRTRLDGLVRDFANWGVI